MDQITLTDIEYSNRKKKTKREEFHDAMEKIIPWSYWVDMIRPYYFNNKRGRRPIGIETMLRMGIYPKGTQRKYLQIFLKTLQSGIMLRIRLINQCFPKIKSESRDTVFVRRV